MASLQLPAKYTQLPALLIGQIGTLIWCIERHYGVIAPKPRLMTRQPLCGGGGGGRLQFHIDRLRFHIDAPGRIRLMDRVVLIEIDIRVISICGSKPLSSKR